jgi:microcin C transport system substrate-binding protein
MASMFRAFRGGISVRPQPRRLFRLLVFTAVVVAAACGGGGEQQTGGADTASPTAPATAAANVAMNKDAYPVFASADAGADPAVSAEQGGKGFTGQGWETNTTFDLIGDPRAVKGGVLRQAMMTDFPSTLRYYGPNVTAWNQMLHSMVYETLLNMHPTSLDYIPGLATHWQVSADKQTFRFRLDPNARWSDGQPFTSADVIASWKLVVDRTLQDPAQTEIYSNFDMPIAESKYMVSVHAKSVNWQNLLYFSGLLMYPAHVLKNIDGAAYIRDYNYKMLPGTGPYMVSEQDVEKGKSIKIKRRMDYWAAKDRRAVGVSNFNEVQQIVVRDRNLEFEMFKKGDIDYYYVQRAQMWAEQLEYPNIKRGLNQKRKIFNNNPQGLQGFAMNTRRAPYGDIRVRKALAQLFNRDSLVEKLMYNQYVTFDSVYPASVYENPNNERVKYNPAAAIQLLAEAGWTARDSAGRLVKDGRPFSIEIIYGDQASERFLTVFQEDLRKVGITLNLRLVTFETMVKLIDDRSFDMVSAAYTGSVFPSPEAEWKSVLADQKNTNNITGFKNKRADEIIAEYAASFDVARRIKLLQEFDGIVTSEHHWIFEWTAPFQRVVYWNRFGQPTGILTRTGDYRDIPSLWWFDSAKAAKLDEAIRNPSVQLGEGPTEDRYWIDFGKQEAQQKASTATK